MQRVLRRCYCGLLAVTFHVCCISANAEGQEFALLKTLWSVPLDKCFISFAHSQKRLMGPTNEVVTDNFGGTVTIPRESHFYFNYSRNRTNAIVARSNIPLDRGFMTGAWFSAAGVFRGTNWRLSPVGQLHYEEPAPSRPVTGPSQLLVRGGYFEADLLLGLGVNVEPGTVTWFGNAFTGTAKASFLGSRAKTGRYRVKGIVMLTNGVPSAVSYGIGEEAFFEVRYGYERKLDLPFPSQIEVTTFRRAAKHLQGPVSIEHFDINEARPIDPNRDLDRDRFGPKFYANTSGQPIHEFLVSDGIAIGSLRNGAWLFDKSQRLSHSTVKRVFIVLLFLIALVPVAWLTYKHFRARRNVNVTNPTMRSDRDENVPRRGD